MSNSYFLYTEVKTDKGWECVDPYLPKDGKWILTETFESGSRTYFGETFDELRHLGTTNPQDLSEAVLAVHPMPKEDKEDAIFHESEYLKQNRVAIPLTVIQNKLPKNNQKQHSGFYHKDRIYEFENGEREDLFECDIEPEDYAKLPQEMKDKLYVYYEWDEPWGWPMHFRTIVEEADRRIYVWKNINQRWFDELEARIIAFCY